MAEEYKSGYGSKRPLWQWIAIYAVIGLIVYGLVYYFVLAPKSVKTGTPAPVTQTTNQDTVILTANNFEPSSITVKVGTKVTWINKSGVAATVDSDSHPIHTDYQPLNLGRFSDGESLSLTFDKPGSYKYHNHLNAAQTGTVVVQ